MKFYEALKYLLNTCSNTKITRKSWRAGIYLTKSTITVGEGENKKSIPSIDIVEIIGGQMHKTTFHANPETLMSDDWYCYI